MEGARRPGGPEHKAPPPEHKATERKAPERKTEGAAERAFTPPPVLRRQHGHYPRGNPTGS